MSINTTNSINQASNSLREFAQKTQGSKGELNKNDFLNLFMTQVSNQDPMSPMDSAGMMTQLSQLGSMEQLQNLNTKVEALTTLQEKQMKLGTAGYLGLEVSYLDNSVQMSGGSVSPISYKLEDDTRTAKAQVVNSQGEIVKEMTLGAQTKGVYPLKWDGMNDKGETVPDGEYNIEILAVSEKGSEVNVDMNRKSRIDKVSFDGAAPVFHVGDRKMSLDEIQMYDRKVQNLLGAGLPFGIKEETRTAK